MLSTKQRKLQNQRLQDIAKHAELERQIIALRDDLEIAEDEEIDLERQLKAAQKDSYAVLQHTTGLEDAFEDYRLDMVLGVGVFRSE